MMKTGFKGTYIISWAQSEIDGIVGAPVADIGIGTTWRWTGTPMRVDAPRDILILGNSLEIDQMSRRAALRAQKLLGLAVDTVPINPAEDDNTLFDACFDVTDGYERYRVTLIALEGSTQPILLFADTIPPCDQDLWVVHCATDKMASGALENKQKNVICFVPGTRILTPAGPTLVEDLIAGDQISTKDNGAQDIQWIGNRKISGARLFAMPHMKPIRLRANILGQGEPDQDLIVSPDHRILLQGDVAQSLFNTPEVLVTARDLVNDSSITVDHSVRALTYIHLMLDQHQIVWANGVESESFHPAGVDLNKVEPGQKSQFDAQFPELGARPEMYGEYARRNLNASEAALLAFGASSTH